MARVVDQPSGGAGAGRVICDFSPPRSGDPASLKLPDLPAAFIAVNYNPGRAVRVNPAMAAAAIKLRGGPEAAFIMATRDMNRLALQSLLLGAQLMGLENVIVTQGDPFSRRDLARARPAGDITPTGLIAAIAAMNSGADFRGNPLPTPTNFCIGATLDPGRDLRREARLAQRKVKAGAQFFVTQPIYDPADASRFLEAYAHCAGEEMPAPVFYGLHILERGGVAFSPPPESVQGELDKGRPGVDIALEQRQRFREAGFSDIYLLPPIRPGGERDYAAAQEFLTAVKA